MRAEPQPLILASASPRRLALLCELGLPFQVIVSNVAETWDVATPPHELANVLAERKARAVAASVGTGLVLGADTMVVLDDEFLGKPEHAPDASRMLRRLSGREHDVITGLVLVDAATGTLRSGAVTSTVRLRALSDDDIAAYVATGEPLDKAGAYAIQGIGSHLIAGLEGCFTNVVGLPLCETARLLTDAGLAIAANVALCRLPDGSPCPRLV